MAKTNADHALAAAKASVSLIPWVGSPLASLIGDYVPSSTQRAWEQFLDNWQEELEAVNDRIDIEAVDKDEFAELFKSSYLVVVRTHHEEKLRAAARLMTNILLLDDDPSKMPYKELDHFVRCLEGLSIGALEVLAVVARRFNGSTAKGSPSANRLSLDDLYSLLPDYEPDLVMGLVSELNSMHLLRFAGVPPVQTPNSGNFPLKLTDLGLRFVDHLLRTPESDEG